MKTKNELKGIVKHWWDYNQTMAQMPEAQYLVEQIYDYESDYKTFQTEGYQKPEVDFDVVRAKDVKDGISFKIVSGDVYIDGILNVLDGSIVLKEVEGNNLGEHVFIGARMMPE